MWDWAIWGALIVAWLAGVAALVLVVRRSLTAWRKADEVRRDMVGRLDELTAKAEVTAERAAGAGDTAELQESVGRLQVSLAQLAVLTAALDEARITFGRIAAVVPRK
jgi:hypothetical protein